VCLEHSAKGGTKENAKILKSLIQLKWRNRWTQPRIASSCPIAPLKKAIPKRLSPLTIYKIKL